MKTKNKKKKSDIFLELDGKVFIVEKSGSKVLNKTELEAKLVLEILLMAVEDSLRRVIYLKDNGVNFR